MLERNSPLWDNPANCLESGDGESDETDDYLPAMLTINLYRNGDMTLVMADVNIAVTSQGLEQLVHRLMLRRVLFVKLIRVNADNAKSGKNV